jgi:hypothetical protein
MRQVLATILTALITLGPLLTPEIASAGPNTAELSPDALPLQSNTW